jgi:hypothetical protein
VRVYNLTDLVTPSVSAWGLENTTITVGGVPIPPGECADVPQLSGDDQVFLRRNAIAVGEPPSWYRIKKAAVPAPLAPEPAPVVVEKPPAVSPDPPTPEVEEHVHTAETMMPGSDPPPEPPPKKKRRGKRS